MSAARPRLPRLLELLDRLPTARVLVIGDAVLDEFVFGEIARVSREAPVLILEHRRTEFLPGGAANTAANLAALDVRTAVCGRIGDGAHAEQLCALLDDRGVDAAQLVADPEYVTPTKSRILAGSPHTAKQQIVRVDRGRTGVPVPPRLARRLQAIGRDARRTGWSLLLADYGYGSVTPELASGLGRGPGPITLDSRFQLERFRGVTAATPNLEELERTQGRRFADADDESIGRAAAALRRRIGAEALLVTRGSHGMTLAEHRRRPVKIPVFGSDEVADVTGAGDTVIAVFTAARAAGATWREAMELANVAGGLVVMKRGTATVSRGEMAEALRDGWEDAAGA
jgi:rfaE bifunctional protein kinase chain/domain